MCRANAKTWETPTLEPASAGVTLDFVRYRMLSATPPTAAGVTRVTNDPASWARKVRTKLSFSSTKPDSEKVAPT